jgi:hypothetical protein
MKDYFISALNSELRYQKDKKDNKNSQMVKAQLFELLKAMRNNFFTPIKYKKIIENNTNAPVENFDIRRTLNNWGVNDLKSYETWFHKTRELERYFLNILRKENIKQNIQEIDKYLEKGRIPEITYSMVFYLISETDEFSQEDKKIIKKYLSETIYFSSMMVFKNVLGKASANFIKKGKNSTYSEKEKYKKIIISNTSRIIWMGENRDTINKAMDLKSSLKFTEIQNETLKRELKNVKQNAELSVIFNLLKEMNSFKYEEIISNVFLACSKFSELEKEQISLPKEFKYMELTIKLMKKFFNDIGVTEYGTLNELICADEKVVEKYEYLGKPFLQNEKKNLQLIKTGIMYKGKVISKPVVKEIE